MSASNITHDCSRSLKRKWFAKKMLATIQDIQVPAKRITWDGFDFKVWQQDDLSGGRVTAPMGATVVCCRESGLALMTAEYWLGGFTPPRNYKIADTPNGYEYSLNGQLEVPVMDFLPTRIQPGDDTFSPPSVVVIPTPADAFFVGLRFKYLTGTADTEKRSMFEICLNWYEADGSLPMRIGSVQSDYEYFMMEVYQTMPTASWYRTINHRASVYSSIVIDGVSRIVCGRCWERSKETIVYKYLFASDIFSGVPNAIKAFLLQDNERYAFPVGSYAFATSHESDYSFLHGVIVEGPPPETPPYDPLEQYFTDNPADLEWLLFYSLSIPNIETGGHNVYTFSSGQFINVLHDVAGGIINGGEIDYPRAKAVFKQLFPRPNYNSQAPFDSVMFHSDTSVYTWTRKYGAFEFSKSGLSSSYFSVPAEVLLTDGVRPDITHAGNGRYICVCQKDGVSATDNSLGVKGVHAGSPFSGWERLPDPIEGELVYVRPVLAEAQEGEPVKTILIGVLKIFNNVTGLPEYFFALFNSVSWQKLGLLAVDVQDGEWASWSVSTWGIGFVTDALAKYPAPPAILPQMVVNPYESYAAGMP